MYKDLVVPITATSGDKNALDYAIKLANSMGAHLTVLEIVNLPMPTASPWGLMPDMGMSGIYGTLRELGESNVLKLKVRLANESVSTEVKLVESLFSEPPQMAAYWAHFADLTIVAGSIGDTAEAVVPHAFFSSLLFESGRPVLVVPPHCEVSLLPQRIVAAWRPTREATRALHDAMPLLKQAEAVDLLVVDPVEGERGDGRQPGTDIATHLARLGVKTNVVIRKSNSASVSETLLEHAREMRADLIVVGGYGHSRAREWAFGGVTRELLIASPIPVFYSH